jgi:hypothetical protein
MICGYAGRWTDIDDIGMNGAGFGRVGCQDVPRSDTFRDAASFPVAARQRRPRLHGSMPSFCAPNFGWLEGRLLTHPFLTT